jgi:hypothetical protein
MLSRAESRRDERVLSHGADAFIPISVLISTATAAATCVYFDAAVAACRAGETVKWRGRWFAAVRVSNGCNSARAVHIAFEAVTPGQKRDSADRSHEVMGARPVPAWVRHRLS